MTITIGRATMPDPSTITRNGDTLSLSGMAYSTASSEAGRATELAAWDQQVNGLANNPDEPVVPLTWTIDARMDGFYRVLGASFDYLNDGSAAPALATYSITLERIATWATAAFETDVLSFVRTNSHAVASAEGVIAAWPSIYGSKGHTTAMSSVTIDSRTGVDGAISIAVKTISAATSGQFGYTAQPDTHYDNGATIEYKADDDVWYPVIGRQIPAAATGRWRISNGLVRLSCNEASAGNMDVAVHNGTSWETGPVSITGNAYSSGTGLHYATPLAGYYDTANAWAQPVVLRNDPDCVVVRVAAKDRFGDGRRTLHTFTLRRGQMVIEFNRTGEGTLYTGLRFASSVACSATATAGAGIVETAADANGNKIVLFIATPDAATSVPSLADGQFYATTAVATATFGIGVILDAASPATYGTEAKLLAQFLAATNVKTNVVRL